MGAGRAEAVIYIDYGGDATTSVRRLQENHGRFLPPKMRATRRGATRLMR